MAVGRLHRVGWLASVACFMAPLIVGCRTTQPFYVEDLPRELAKVPLAQYVIEPPDILLIDALRVIPLPPYKIEPMDAVFIQATNTLPTEPISGVFSVEPGGFINLGPSYGSVQVLGLPLEGTREIPHGAREAIEERLKKVLTNPQVTVSLAQSRAMQQIRGEHMVVQDGTVSLGIYGSVAVVGKTLDQAKAAIEQHLSQYLYKPEVSVDVYAFNSKVYYVITDGGGFGEQVLRVPVTGNETVLDAISQINGLPAVACKKGVWIARPTRNGDCRMAKLPVDWSGIVRDGQSETNYQVMPGDRIYVMAEPLITMDTVLSRYFAPIERVLGVTLLGSSTVRSFNNNNNNNNGGIGF